MIYGVIYKISNSVNDKLYFGQTRQPPNRRWSQHKSAAKKGINKMILYNSIRLHGVDKFNFEVVCECETLEKLNAKEIEYISNNNTLAPNGYNTGRGGDNYEKSPETCKKISETNKGSIIDNVWRKNLSDAHKGRKITEETRAKMCAAQKGRINEVGLQHQY